MANANVIETLISGSGTVTLESVSYSTVQGGTAKDTIKARLGSNFNRYEGGEGDDTFFAYESVASASDVNTLGGVYANTISGGKGNDTIFIGPQSKANFTTTISDGDRYQNMRSYGTVIEYSNDDGDDTVYDSSKYSDYTIKLTAGKFATTVDDGTDIKITVSSSAASTTENNSVLTLKNATGAELSFTADGELFVSRGHDSNALGGKVTLTGGYNDDNKAVIAAAKDEEGTAATIINRGENVSIGSAGKAGTFKDVTNYGAKVSITASAASTIDNHGAAAVIKGSGSNDVIYNYNDGNNITGLAGNDEIINYAGHKSSLLGGAGDDKISVVSGSAVIVNGEAGADEIYNSGTRTSINGGAGNDEIYSSGEKATIIGGAGNDKITLSGNGAVVQYSSGMGLDVIYGFGANDTLYLDKGNITDAAIDGSDVVLTVANQNNTITLKNAKETLSQGNTINLKVGTFETVEVTSDTLTATALATDKKTPRWNFTGDGTATYGTAAQPTLQITGLNKNVNATNVEGYLSVKGKSVTILKDGALAEGTVSINGGTLALSTAVTKSTTKAGSWKVASGTAIYTTEKVTAGYTLASNKKSITYSAASELGGTVTVMISGLNTKAKASDFKTAMNESTGVITLSKAVLPAASGSVDVEMTNLYDEVNYTLAFGKGVATSSTTDAGWSMSGTTASYKTGGTTGAYEISDTDTGQKITYNTTTTKPQTLATLTGLKKGTKAASVFVNNNVITLTKDLLGTTNLALTTTPGTETEDWKMKLADGIVEPTIEKEGYWKTAIAKKKIANNVQIEVSATATFYTPKITKTGVGYTISEDGKNVTYYANGSGNKASLVLQGLAPDVETDQSDTLVQGTLTGVEYDTKNNIITISDGAINPNDKEYGVGGIKISGTVNPGAKFIIDSDKDVKLTNSTKNAVIMQGNTGSTFFVGGGGVDTLYSGDGDAKTLQGGAGNDILYGQNTGAVSVAEEEVIASVLLDGGAGDDVINSGAGGASLSGGAGNDTLNGGAGNDTLDGGAGNDYVSVGSGVALADGGAGNDTIYGGSGIEQTLLGNAGNDTIYGKNTEVSKDDDGEVIIDAETGYASVVLNGGAGNDVMYAGTGGGMMFGDAGNDKLSGDAGVDILYGGLGNDTLDGGAGNDRIFGYMFYDIEGMDSATAKAATVAAGKDGADLIHTGAGNDIVYAGAGNDIVYADSGENVLYGEAGNDKMYAGTGKDTLFGGAGNDTLYAGAGSATLYGDDNEGEYSEITKTANVLYGSSVSSGSSELYGGKGADTLYGGEGSVTMTGGDGADVFVYDSTNYGVNVIADFTVDVKTDKNGNEVLDKYGNTIPVVVDKIKFADIAFTKLADFETLVSGSVVGGNVVFNFSGGKTLTVENAAGKQLTFVSSKGKTVSKTYSAESGLFAEDNFITADNLSQIVETSSIGDFEFNTNSDKLQAENLITYADK